MITVLSWCVYTIGYHFNERKEKRRIFDSHVSWMYVFLLFFFLAAFHVCIVYTVYSLLLLFQLRDLFLFNDNICATNILLYAKSKTLRSFFFLFLYHRIFRRRVSLIHSSSLSMFSGYFYFPFANKWTWSIVVVSIDDAFINNFFLFSEFEMFTHALFHGKFLFTFH